jgi:hypothetical protein
MAAAGPFSDFSSTFSHGDRFLLAVTVKIDGVATDVTAWTQFWFTAKKRVGDPDSAAVFQKTLTGGSAGITKTTPLSGLLQVSIAEADTSALANVPLKLFCDLRGKDGSGDIWTLARGFLTILPSVYGGAV